MGKFLKCLVVLAATFVLWANTASAAITKTVDGYVQDTLRNIPVAGATVTFTPTSVSQTSYTATTNSAGYYAIAKLGWYSYENSKRIGYKITVTAAGYDSFSTASGSPVYFNGSSRYNVSLKSTSAAELKGAVTDQTGKKLAGITVTLKPVYYTYYGYQMRDYTAVTDANGNYDLTGILAYVQSSGHLYWAGYNLCINAVGFNNYASGVLGFATQRLLTHNVTLTYAGQHYEGYVSQVIYSQDTAVTGYNERYCLVKNTGEAIGYIGIDRSNGYLVPFLQTAFQARCKVLLTAGRIDKDAIFDVSYIELGDSSTGLSRIENKLGTVKE
ncbi:MAG: carboxypeptidase-like regulatory domain-containing protein [Candidatus Omnitrophota bacterium]|nr:carboxypeptidase-like regulatory domain-containing protein [Candidatus Omnitrophota bacterium]